MKRYVEVSSEFSEYSHGADGPDQDPFARLDIFQHDPRFEEILSMLREMQTAYSQLDHDEVHASLEEINEELDDTEWIGSGVVATGKLRPAPWAETNPFELPYFRREGIKVGEDEKGRYIDMTDMPLIMGIIDVDDEDEDEGSESDTRGTYVLTFHSPDAILEIQDEPSEVRELLSSAGDLMMYPDELMVFTFDTPSVEQIEQTLKLYYPQVYKAIKDTISEGVGIHGQRVLRELQKLRIPEQREDILNVFDTIGRYIYSRMDIDSEADYRFVLDGSISGASIEQGIVQAEQPRDTRLTGRIVTIDIDEETLTPVFIVAELSFVGEGYEARALPIESVQQLQCLRPIRSRFGEIAMKNFDSPDEIKDYWLDARSSEKKRGQQEVAELFGEISSFFDQLRDQYVFNEREKFYEFPIDDDVAQLYAQYLNHLETSRELLGDGSGIESFGPMLRKDIESLENLEIDDPVATKGQTVFIAPDLTEAGEGYDAHILVDAQRLKGTFSGLVVARFPSEGMITTGGELQQFELSLGMVLSNATVFDDTPEEDRGVETFEQEVIVMTAPFIGTKFVKLVI